MYTANKIETFRPAHRQGHRRSRMHLIFCLLITVLLCLTAASNTASAATYYLDAVNGNDSYDGLAPEWESGTHGPWKTVAKAESSVVNGSTVYLRSGNYGEVYINRTGLNRTSWDDGVTYMADDGQDPVFIQLRVSGDVDRYVEFNDISIIYPYTFGYGADAIVVENSDYVRLINLDIHGTWLPDNSAVSAKGVVLRSINNILVEGCEIKDFQRGLSIGRSGVGDNIVLRNNHIHHIVGTGIELAESTKDNGVILIEGNHIHNQHVLFGAHGSGLEIRCSNVTVRGNIVHDFGNTRPIRTYGTNSILRDPTEPYDHSNMLFENNLVYDAKNWYPVEFTYIGDNFVFRNNTVIGKKEPSKYGTALMLRPGVDSPEHQYGAGFSMYNNILVGKVSIYFDTPYAFNEDNNIIWEHSESTLTVSMTNTKIIKIGGVVSDEDYFEAAGNFFSGGSDPALFNTYSYTVAAPGTHKQNLNDAYKLADGSDAIGFANPAYAPNSDILGVSRVFPPDVLPPDAGCYEYVSDPNVHTHDLSVSSTTGGTVTNPGVGQFSYDHGSEVSIGATAADNYHFVNWTGTAVDAGKVADPSDDSTTVTIDANYKIQANFAIDQHQRTLEVSSTSGGTVTNPGEGQFSYDHGSEVTIVAAESLNYHFVNWTRTAVDAGKVAEPSNASTTVMIDADYKIQANFAIDQHQHTLEVSSTSGSTVSNPGVGSFSYDHGSEVSIEAKEGLNYHFVNWTGTAVDAGKVAEPSNASTTIMIDADYKIQANFAIDQRTLKVLPTSGGTVTNPGEGQFSYDHGSEVSIEATESLNYHFVNWTGTAVDAGKVAEPSDVSTIVTMDANYTLQANFAIDEVDGTAPAVTNLSPDPNDFMSDSVPLNSLILLDITDTGKGVDRNTVEIRINNDLIYDGDNETSAGVYNSTGHVQTIKGICRRIGSSAAYKYIFQPDEKFDYDQELSTAVNAADLATPPNTMSEYQYSLISEMRSFGEKKTLTAGKEIISSGANKDSERPLTTVSDSSGNVWVAWTEGDKGPNNSLINRDIWIGKLTVGAESFENGGVRQVTNDAHDQSNPVLAIDSSDMLYLAWQDERNGKWDLFISTSADGTNWTAEKLITDPNYNQTNPAMAIDSSDEVYIVYDDDQNTDKDIYITSSSDTFSTQTKTQITSAGTGAVYDQTTPDIAIDSADTVYVVWADARNWNGKGNIKYDMYGAASDNSWTNIEIVDKDKDGQQTAPKIATEDTGTILHFVWVDDEPGDKEVYYGSSDGLPGTPLTGTNIIDQGLPNLSDGKQPEQKQPALAVTGYTGGTDDDVLKVFACWEDERYNKIENIHAVEMTNLGINIWVGDDGAGNDQKVPAIGIDPYNHPYLVWVNNKSDIIYTGSTFIDPDPLVPSTPAPVSSNMIIGTPFGSINDNDDVSVEIPARAYLCDMNITISKIRNPQKAPSNNRTFLYEFGPSGTTFSKPVTITIPYNATTLVSSPSAYWYNPLTGLYSQEGITDVEVIQISSGLYALRFKTTHFSIFGGGGPFDDIFGGGGGGGGCSMSPNSQDSIAELLLPYIGLAVAMVILKLRDIRKRKAHNITKSGC